VGALRWRAPAPVSPWTGERPALDYGPSCPQARTPDFVRPDSRAIHTSEDCLTLNVWSPDRAAGAPVVVWIHGGANVAGTASQTFYDGTAFARDGVVLVSLNYRLGLLGFFAHPALDGGPANFALLDQIAALNWVKRNVKAFGGDPENVTVMGESAGGQDIEALLASPLAKGLFRKAILESPGGGWNHFPTLAMAQAQGQKVGAALGAQTAQALRDLSADALVKAANDVDINPILDSVVLSQTPAQAIAAGRVPAIPLLIGTNGWEGSLLPPGMTLKQLDSDLTPAETDAIKGFYGPVDEQTLVQDLFRDGYFAAPSRWAAAHWPGPAYLYRFDYVAAVLRARRPGAAHGSEIPFVFDTVSFARTPDDHQTAALLHGCWVAFIRTGVPSCPGAPAWPAYRASDDRLMRLDAPPVIAATPQAKAIDQYTAHEAPPAAPARP
jgi:para-nitrobenzyl esterase